LVSTESLRGLKPSATPRVVGGGVTPLCAAMAWMMVAVQTLRSCWWVMVLPLLDVGRRTNTVAGSGFALMRSDSSW